MTESEGDGGPSTAAANAVPDAGTADAELSLGIALSGGGIRAMAFHAGVLRFLAEQGALERVSQISTVSGGSLFIGLVFHLSEMRWPDSGQYLEKIYPALERFMCTKAMMWAMVRKALLPWNWHLLASRPKLLAKVLGSWGIKQPMSALPTSPAWSINATTLEAGRRFRFKRESFGDWQLGYVKTDRFPMADAMAVSAAVPAAFGPLKLKASGYSWRKRGQWDLSASEVETAAPFKSLHLLDGGVYDNLGLEPFFDVGNQLPKTANLVVYVSDASAPLRPKPATFALHPGRLKRLADIMTEQSRALRVRAFMAFLRRSPRPAGAYVYMGAKPDGASTSNREMAWNFSTTLRKLSRDEFAAIAEHGYAVAVDAEARFGLLAHAFKPGCAEPERSANQQPPAAASGVDSPASGH